MDLPVYLDNAATTPLHPQVAFAMRPFLGDVYGNPSSVHQFGQQARRAVEQARSHIAQAIGAHSRELIFTSGGTEADFLALVGVLRASDKRHLVTSRIEHHAVLQTCTWLQELGYEVTYVSPDATGYVAVEEILAALRPDTGLVSLMWVNNETGTVQPIERLSRELSDRRVLLHSDAVQALPSISIDVNQVPVSLLSFSGHKIYGPKGIGALYLREGTPFSSVIRGGHQERDRRAGTENVAAAVGFGVAVEQLRAEWEDRVLRISQVREQFLSGLQRAVTHWRLNGAQHAVPSICNVTFTGVQADALVMALDLDGIAISTGSACSAGAMEPSHVLLAMGIPEEEVLSSVRISFSSFITRAQVDRAVDRIAYHVHRLRVLNGTDL
ncbi:cysteine desulfurase family protein [Sulfoacidibacillus thermotolerans]|uniref:Aminotransferase class V domain-containing protein n=1 Tax=Sulfoacidibacillus thermotolerans TaxID=1765684 RepID=A0A2U3D909_SULT2|nr:cysteine desulfurase family protein [Sulfoacidibacillus thermotolerans]PWI57745.1 hypothetical protein BM613_07120 [Sulfoacidibacillus thermotolerans]